MAVSMIAYKVTAFGISDVGRVREDNEDAWSLVSEINFFVLADGMGGHQAGEVASHEAVKSLCGFASKHFGSENSHSFHDMRKIVKQAIEQVNAQVYKMSRSQTSLKGMGTTLCCILFHNRGIVYAHVGDSRIYRFRSQHLDLLTKDHSLYRELIDQGHMIEKQKVDFLYKNIITKAIGTEPYVEPSVHLSDLEDGDIYMMCTDGLSDLLTINEIQNILNHEESIENSAKELVATANARGGYDNVTVVIMQVTRTNGQTDLPR